jgi:hypothetical protein
MTSAHERAKSTRIPQGAGRVERTSIPELGKVLRKQGLNAAYGRYRARDVVVVDTASPNRDSEEFVR